ncbi:hypothetical protein BLNAU_14574 [Blattamonas nauphoetae]|uniref:Uncharacterized protein n=1 Tax=Blattamonas nauphoetae TaxID=2049346 RepID=A0ABQ9XJN3_9EUKA|nr:hypothetical protein BLNAU_14574 [Blattamonas nauphoetae]
MDYSPFLHWTNKADENGQEKAVVFRSLVVTLKLQPALDVSLEAKAVKFLESVVARNRLFADSFLGTLASNSGDSSPDFVQSIVVLISSASQAIATASMEMLHSLFDWCSAKYNLTLVKADLIAQLIDTLNPQSLSFAETVDIHTCLMNSINWSTWLSAPDGLEQLETKDDDEEQAVHETRQARTSELSEPFVSSFGHPTLTIRILSRQSRSMLAALSFAFTVTLALLLSDGQCVDQSIATILRRSEDVVAHFYVGLNPCSVTALTLPLSSTSPSPPTPSHSPLPLPHHPHPPTLLFLSLTTHTLPLPTSPLTTHTLPLPLPLLTTHTLPLSSTSPSPPTPSHSPLPLPHHPHPPTLLCLSLTTHTLPLPSASPSPPTPSHSPLPLPHHPHPPTLLFLSLTTHTLPLSSSSPSPPTPPTPSASPHHPHPPTLLYLSLTTHTLPLSSASPSPPTPSHSPLPLPHHPHPPTPLCLSLTTHTLPLPSASPLTTLCLARADGCSFTHHSSLLTCLVSDTASSFHTIHNSLSPPFIIPFLLSSFTPASTVNPHHHNRRASLGISLDDRHTLLRRPSRTAQSLTLRRTRHDSGRGVGKASRKEEKGLEPANADCQPLLRPDMDSRVAHTVTELWKATGARSMRMESTNLRVCQGGRRSWVSLFVVLVDDTATDDRLSPHSSPKPTPTALEERTRLLLTDLRGSSRSEQGAVQAEPQNTDTADLASTDSGSLERLETIRSPRSTISRPSSSFLPISTPLSRSLDLKGD